MSQSPVPLEEAARMRIWANLDFAANAKLYDLVVSVQGTTVYMRIEWPDVHKKPLERGI